MSKEIPTIELRAGEKWREFVDDLERVNPDVYLNLWMKSDKKDPKIISEDFQRWRLLVQGAFISGYYKGFERKITGE